MTRQRALILDIMREKSPQHLTADELCAKQPIIIPEIWLDKPRKFGIIEANQDKFLKIKKYYKRRQYYGTERQQDREKPVGGFRW